MTDKTTEALARIDQPGRVTWHSSGEGEGPDVGLSFGLGNGTSLFVGEMTRAQHAASAETAGHLGDATGWWIILHDAEVARVIGKTAEPEAGRALIDALSEAWNRRPSVQEAAPADLTETAKRIRVPDAERRMMDRLRSRFDPPDADAHAAVTYIEELLAGLAWQKEMTAHWCDVAAARAVPAPVPEGVIVPAEANTAIRARAESRAIDFGLDFDKFGGDEAIDALYRAMVSGGKPSAPTPTAQGMGWQDTEAAAHFLIAHSLSQGCDRYVWKLEHDDPEGGIDQWVVEVRPNYVKLPSAPASTSAGEA
ncbi:hypothetical protein [Azospirillum argentinense]|uniref:hypothetical protein n=1 Tax=Azospirillum argentinense TaxID=2970906 RepID=UPI0032DF8B3A